MCFRACDWLVALTGEGGGLVLLLEVLDFAGLTRWRWRLSRDGVFVADHEVELDAGDWQFDAFTDLSGYLRRFAAPDRRLASEAEITAKVGEWVGTRVLGPVGVELARARQVVQLQVPSVPAQAAVLGHLPWELARVEGRALGLDRVVFVIDQANGAGGAVGAKVAVGDRLRVLGVFSLPVDASALNLRRERYALARLVQEIATSNGKAIELRVLQYGATRERLREVLLEGPGWDVVHLSGHGLPTGLLLEDDAGQHDKVSSTELVDLLDLAGEQIKLVTLSTCDSAALAASEHLRLLGLPTGGNAGGIATGTAHADGDGEDGGGDAAGGSLPAVAAALSGRLGCAVLAMRYPVVDDFAIALSGSFYDLVLGKGQPVARALGLSLPGLALDPPTAGAPALSLATPTLFGASAADLRLVAPAGAAAVFKAEEQKLARFEKQPERFVGRVGPLTRATTALAPRSGRAGVLFHGMAGAGKTACALELAYTHEASFALLVWHQAPAEGHDIGTAFGNLAQDLEAQIPGLQMVHLAEDPGALAGFLPKLAEFLEQQRVLLVLDNLESLLTAEGAWRDPRWEQLVDAVTGHGGLSRVVLTSRVRPAHLPEGLLVEPVHALSLPETVLLAREWPHLRALIDGTAPAAGSRSGAGSSAEAARRESFALAVRTLTLVQGHPKLVELANGHAGDLDELRARLDAADRAWLATGVHLDTFLDTGEPAATDLSFLHVLADWTRGASTTLPPAAATLFAYLCCLEPADRIGQVIEANWADLWRRLELPGDPPDLEPTIAVLVDKALVAVEPAPDTGRVARVSIHPGVGETGRTTAGPDLPKAVDTELAGFWVANLGQALRQEGEGLGWLVARAARAAAPYLARQRNWAALNTAMGQVLLRDMTPDTIAALLPVLGAAAAATKGSDDEYSARFNLARALTPSRPVLAEAQLRQLLDGSIARKDFRRASAATNDLINLCRDQGRLDEALTLLGQKKDYTRLAVYGPWTVLLDEAQRLQILSDQGHSQQVLDAVTELRTTMADLPEHSEADEVGKPWNVRELILNVGCKAALELGRWQVALDFGADVAKSEKSRDAGSNTRARTAFNNYFALLRLGRTTQARDLLLACRAVFEEDHDIEMLGKTLSSLADVEDKLGHQSQAIQLEKDALRLKYTQADPKYAAVSHNNLANYLTRHGDDPDQVRAHRVAAAVLAYQIGSGSLADYVRAIAGLLTRPEHSEARWSFADTCQVTDSIEGVHLGDLVAALPPRAPTGQAALDEILRLAAAIPTEEVYDLEHHLKWWEPVVAALVASRAGNTDATHALEQTLQTRGQQPDWADLVTVLAHLHTGHEHDPDLLNNLDPIDTTIATRARDALTGTTTIDPDAWHTLTQPDPPST
jgi:tetratricopeptide (TPR) repeat protein